MIAALPEPIIVVERGLGSARMHPLSVAETLIGSHPSADICLPNPYVSRRHAVIICSDLGVFSIKDLNSRNGTLVNGVEVSESPVEIASGDEIVLGGGAVMFTVHLEGGTRDRRATFPPRNGASIQFVRPKKTLIVDGTSFQLALSTRQCDMFDALFKNPGRIASFDELRSIGWPNKQPDEISMSTLRTHMSVIRASVAPVANNHLRILTLRERGYVLEL